MEIIFITGASGSGKTTLLKKLEEQHQSEFNFYYFDSIGVPSPEQMIEEYGSGEEWQKQTTANWIDKILAESTKKIAILDGQMKLAFIAEACRQKTFDDYRIILIDCDDKVRKQRLNGRGQPELANVDMMNWAKYLRREAQNLEARILDTSSQNPSDSEASLLELIKSS